MKMTIGLWKNISHADIKPCVHAWVADHYFLYCDFSISSFFFIAPVFCHNIKKYIYRFKSNSILSLSLLVRCLLLPLYSLIFSLIAEIAINISHLHSFLWRKMLEAKIVNLFDEKERVPFHFTSHHTSSYIPSNVFNRLLLKSRRKKAEVKRTRFEVYKCL